MTNCNNMKKQNLTIKNQKSVFASFNEQPELVSFLILIAVTFAVYFNSLPNEFIFDDVPLVQNSINITKMSFYDLVFSYRPLRYISLALDYRVFGMEPWGFRLMNILYHSLSVISVFWVLKIFGFSKKAAFVAALLFSIHPVNTDSVSYISGRRDVLMGLFYILSVGFFFKFYNLITCRNKDCKSSPSHNRLIIINGILAAFFLFLSISTKEMGATIPLIFILFIIYKDGSKLLKKRWFYMTAMSFLLLFSFFAFISITGGGSGLVSIQGFNYHGNSPKAHYLTAATIWLHYLKLALFPYWLILDNANYPIVLDWNFNVFFSVLSMFLYGWIVWRFITSESNNKNKFFIEYKSIAFWMVFFVISISPVLQIIPLHEIVALHYLYVPVIGFCAITGLVFDKLTNTTSIVHYKNIFNFLLIILSVFFLFKTVNRNFELKNHWTVFHADQKIAPLSFRGYFTLGAEYLNMKFPDKAWEFYQKALETGSWDGNLLGNIIGYYIVKGNHPAAFEFYEEIERKNEYLTSQGKLNIAFLYMINGICDKAVSLATSFEPSSNQIKRIEFIKNCNTHDFGKFNMENIQDIYYKQQFLKESGYDIERKPYLMELITSEEFSIEERIELIHELAIVNLQSDIPEAIKYYKLEKEMYEKIKKPVPEIVERSIAVLTDYQYKVLVEGRYYKPD